MEFLAQSNYLREVQRTFGGLGNLDVWGVLSQILIVAMPVVVVFALWRYRHVLWFVVARISAIVFPSGKRRAVEQYLVNRNVLLDVCQYTGEGVGRKLCDARVKEINGGIISLQLINVSPAAMKLKQRRVICFMRPFAYSNKRLNAFVTFIWDLQQRGIVIKEMSLAAPVLYRYVIRRRHARQRISRDGAVRVKLWSGQKMNMFWMVRPDLHTVTNPARYGSDPRLVVENISAGGLRLHIVNPGSGMPSLQKGQQLVLRVSVWNPAIKKYSYFTAMGVIRSRFSGKGGSVGLGIQFTHEAEKVGTRYTWHPTKGEIKPLAAFLAELGD